MTPYDIKKMSITDAEYPDTLRKLHDAPKELYYRGNITLLKAMGVALIGTRRSSRHGLDAARSFASSFARAGLTVISGLALGIDAAAHQGALDVRGTTIAVLGSGIDDANLYPHTNLPLARRILETNGLIISENVPGTRPQKWDFPKRNRIVAALASATIVVEAPEKSGALITAKYALELGRDVYVVPADGLKASARGSNKLIGFGAPPLIDPQELIETLKGVPHFDVTPKQPHNQNEASILEALGKGPLHADDVAESAKLPAHTVLATLTALELRGEVQSLGNMRFARATG